jgi:two-component system sensor histidine kinase RegB
VIYGLGNLVENAVDFARNAVTIKWWWDAETVGISITDDGPGFPAEIIDRIGEPYMSRRNPGTSSGGGLGLGLFIAKTLLERSGAFVEFTNAGGEGKGATVDIRWPRDRFLTADETLAGV